MHAQSADNVLPYCPEARPDNAPYQANVYDGAKSDRAGAVKSLPKTQGISADISIILPEDGDGNEDEEEKEEEDDCRLSSVCCSLFESNASSMLEGGPSVSSAGIPGEFNAAISHLCGCMAKWADNFWPDRGAIEGLTAVEHDIVSGYAIQANAAKDIQPLSQPNARIELPDPP